MTPNSPLLSIEDLHLSFSTAYGLKAVVHGINLTVNAGEAVALVGESGSGKSVTAKAIIQLLGQHGHITKGQIWFQGLPLHEATPKQMQAVRGKQIGMIFQDPMTSLNPTMPVGIQIAETLRAHEGLSSRCAKRRSVELLACVGMAEPARRYGAYPFQLSGGMRQRVMIAIALACRPLLLIADEPTTALDVTIQAQILDLLQLLRRETGMGLLLITHDLGVVAGVCDRAVVMQQGVIVETAAVDRLFSSPQHPYTRALLSARQGNSYV